MDSYFESYYIYLKEQNHNDPNLETRTVYVAKAGCCLFLGATVHG